MVHSEEALMFLEFYQESKASYDDILLSQTKNAKSMSHDELLDRFRI